MRDVKQGDPDENRRRKPDSWAETFSDDDFADFIKPIADTLDLYHNQDVDPRAIAISFKQLAEKHPDADLEIVAMEKRGQDKFLLRAKTAPEANHSELSAEYFSTYNQLKSLPQNALIVLIAEKDNQIRMLAGQVDTALKTAIERPSIHAATYHNQGDTMSQAPKKISNFDLKSAQVAGGLVDAETVHANQIGGNIHNYAQQQNLVEAAAEIQHLLQQLEQTYPTNTPLEKQMVVAEALKQIESNPTLKARVIGALKAGGTEALRELVDHPLVNILLAALEGWQEAE
jgi:predicted ATP-dependent protease